MTFFKNTPSQTEIQTIKNAKKNFISETLELRVVRQRSGRSKNSGVLLWDPWFFPAII
jgi:hypothetical protein